MSKHLLLVDLNNLACRAAFKGDNIPRLGKLRGERFYGFTPDGAAELVSQCGSLDAIYSLYLSNVKPDKVREWLEIGRERAFLNRTLAALREDVPLDLDARATRIRGTHLHG